MRKRRAVIVVCAYRAKAVAVLGIFPGLTAERISGEAPWCLALTIDDGNVGLNVPLQKPPQKLFASLPFVCRQTLWSKFRNGCGLSKPFVSHP
jgi:hypothetical protein